MLTEIWTNTNDIRQTRIETADHAQLADGDIRLAIEKFALTSNNVSYAVSGDTVGYWKFFPTGEDAWGKVCVWGIATVEESKCPGIELGERIYGFFPMSSHLVVSPAKVTPQTFFDSAPHRRALPALYNQYQRCAAEPPMMKALEDARCVLFPLFMTGYILADFMLDHDWFGADQIIIGSISSKTGFSAAEFIKTLGYQGQIIGLTSPGNVDFVEKLAVCDQIITYEAIAIINSVSSVFIDMSGNAKHRAELHTHLQDNLVSSQMVGATHWNAHQEPAALPGATPEFFFTPAHAQKRAKEWGAEALMQKSFTASAELAGKLRDAVSIEHHAGFAAGVSFWNDILENKVSGSRGIMISLKDF